MYGEKFLIGNTKTGGNQKHGLWTVREGRDIYRPYLSQVHSGGISWKGIYEISRWRWKEEGGWGNETGKRSIVNRIRH